MIENDCYNNNFYTLVLPNQLTSTLSSFTFVYWKCRKFLQSLPDKGNKVLATIERLKELIARREEVDNTVAQFERMTVSHLVEKTRQNLSESDDEISECKDFASEAHEEFSHAHNKKHEISKSKTGQKRQIFSRKWDYESSVTPPLYKFEVSGSIPVLLLWNLFLESLFFLVQNYCP